ncbi:putative toxin-antitoxin system toxin component, PIN family [Cyanobacterium sp. Dongsha4]|uniref:putative toxin-antitoxin system toxin component, PIN family n=1 Tax=Cyanobacterium sp. DS4 TaxID=2878255 RepID=UPI002E80349B|nr:putative toxin-antitoxin system toxin component, PIN family [Cyanobacterium sp. Dongsha4]WVL00228.1 putative toxin-antitoxin system toxin component, PIN family [Cyanobacterium sp. Dongsha4]
MTDLPKYVLDTNVIISALLFKNSQPRQALDKARQSGIVLMSQEIWTEIQEVLARPKFDKYITYGEKKLFLIELVNTVNFIEVKENITTCRDAKDNKFLELAVSGLASIIVSGDNDLLILNPFQNIPILTVKEFLKNDRTKSS